VTISKEITLNTVTSFKPPAALKGRNLSVTKTHARSPNAKLLQARIEGKAISIPLDDQKRPIDAEPAR